MLISNITVSNLGKGEPCSKSGTLTFVLLCVAPLNLVKGTVVSILTMLLYKRVARPLFGIHS